MADIFKIGDVVHLRAGGPLMVVETIAVTPDGTVMIGCAPFIEGAGKGTAVKFVVPEQRLVSWA